MFRTWCILVTVAIVAVGGCRRAADDDAPAEGSNDAPPSGEPVSLSAVEDQQANGNAAGEQSANTPPSDWWQLLSSYRHGAGAVLHIQARTFESAVFTVAEDAAHDPAALMRVADRALAAGFAEQAAELFERAAELDPANADARMGQAMALVSIGRHEQALPAYEALLERAPDDEAVRFNYAVALSQCGRLDQARGQYETLLDADAANVRARYNLATLLHAQNHLNAAAKQYRLLLDDAARLAPADASAAWASYGHLLLDLQEHEAAFTAFAESAKAQPDDAVAWLNFAAAARAVGRYGTAVAACKRAANLQPQDPAAWARLGELYRELHHATNDPAHLKEAMNCWETSLKLDPDQAELRKRLTKEKSE